MNLANLDDGPVRSLSSQMEDSHPWKEADSSDKFELEPLLKVALKKTFKTVWAMLKANYAYVGDLEQILYDENGTPTFINLDAIVDLSHAAHLPHLLPHSLHSVEECVVHFLTAIIRLTP